MDFGMFFEYVITNLVGSLFLFGISVIVLQNCAKKPKNNNVNDIKPPPGLTHSDRSSRNSTSPGKSISKSPTSLSPSPSASRRSETVRHKRSKETKTSKEKIKSLEKNRRSKSGDKRRSTEERNSRRKKPVERSNDLLVSSTQPSHPTSSDTDSAGTAKIEIMIPAFPDAECPLPQKKKTPSRESAESPDNHVKKEKRASRETIKKPSKETVTDAPVQMKPSRECEFRENWGMTTGETRTSRKLDSCSFQMKE